jgi:hypothetical protein
LVEKSCARPGLLADTVMIVAEALRTNFGDRAQAIAERQIAEGGETVETWREIAARLKVMAAI